MNGRDLTLGLVAGLAVAGAVRRRGSRNDADRFRRELEEEGFADCTQGCVQIRDHAYALDDLKQILENEGFDTEDAWITEMARVLNRLRFPLTVYRGINTDTLDRDKLGPYWTWDGEVAHAFAHGVHASAESSGSTPWLVTAVIDDEAQVNWPRSVQQYLLFSSHLTNARNTDNSLILRDGRGPRILSIQKLNGR